MEIKLMKKFVQQNADFFRRPPWQIEMGYSVRDSKIIDLRDFNREDIEKLLEKAKESGLEITVFSFLQGL